MKWHIPTALTHLHQLHSGISYIHEKAGNVSQLNSGVGVLGFCTQIACDF